MSDEERVIRNKTRAIKKELKRTEPYQPEYIRLGVEPKVPEEISKGDRMYLQRNRNFVTSSKGQQLDPRKSVSRNVEVSSYGVDESARVPPSSYGVDESARVPPSSYGVDERGTVPPGPKQAYVSSGNNIEHAWLPPNAGEPAGDFKYDEVPSPPMDGFNEPTSEPADTNPAKPQPNSSIEVGEYCVVLRGEVIFNSNSIENIEHYIESLIFGDDDNMLKQQDLMVFKRLSVKIGVSVKA